MSGHEDLVIEDTPVRFVPSESGGVRVLAAGTDIGTLEPLSDASGYTACGTDGELLTRPSRWGGEVTARFGSKEVAVRALLSISRA